MGRLRAAGSSPVRARMGAQRGPHADGPPRKADHIVASEQDEPTAHNESDAAQDAVAWPLLDPDALAEIATFGSEVAVTAGQMLYRSGDEPPNFFVVLEGEVEIVREGAD